MDHYAPSPDLSQPWRTRTLIATAVAGVELLALVAVGVVVLGKGWFQHAKASAAEHRVAPTHHAVAAKPKPARSRTRHVAPVRPLLSRARTGLLVLNGNGQNGAAGAEAQTLRAHGYPVVAVTNARRNDYAATIVMYRPGSEREAWRLARDAGIHVVAPLDGVLPSQLKSARLAVIVGRS